MKVIVEKEAVRQILKWSQRAFLVCAVVLLGYFGFALADAWLFQRRASRDLDRILLRRAAGAVTAPASATSSKAEPAPAAGTLIGRIQIPRLQLSVVVIEGVDKTSLRRAVGHIPGTALPGAAGNIGLAGHRDTFFRPLKDLKLEDEIQVSTPLGAFKYKVVWLRIVDPEDVGVLASSSENLLTLVTCYPFYFVGPAPKRWIVRAKQVSSQPMPLSNVK